MADLANIAAATTAGYKETVFTRLGKTHVVLEKTLTGDSKSDIVQGRAYGEGVDQASAETVALAALNAQRAHRLRGSNTVDVT